MKVCVYVYILMYIHMRIYTTHTAIHLYIRMYFKIESVDAFYMAKLKSNDLHFYLL